MSRDITLLHPEVQAIIPKFLEECKKQGLIVKITDTVRTKEEQNALYSQGRTTPGKIVTNVMYPYSNHNWGMAFDICRNDGKGAYNDADGWFAKVGAIGVKYGLEWGGYWKGLVDKPHFELTKYGTTEQLHQKYNTPENFKKTWKEIPKYMHEIRNYTYNGKTQSFDVINENGVNYVKVRDLASLLNKQISYNNNTKITSFEDTLQTVEVENNGNVSKNSWVNAVNVGGFNYIKARDLADVLGYETGYNETTGRVFFKIKNSIIDKLKTFTKS